MLKRKIRDAINDPIFGVLIDKIRFKKGKFVPWLRISLVGIPLATILMFAIPSGAMSREEADTQMINKY